MMIAPFSSRSAHRLLALLMLPLTIAGDAALAGAQERVEITTRTRTARAESAERTLRVLKLRADSLARLYSDDADALSAAERRRVGDELDRTIEELERTLTAIARMERTTSTFRVQVAPMADARGGDRMSIALRQGGSTLTVTPRGWLGIVVNGVAREPRIEGGELIVHYLSYPEIISVEPSSPAERAGLAPGDTLIAYDGRDVRDVDLSMTRLLKPNARVLVRIGREGRQRDVPVTIADAPSRIVLRAEEMSGVASLGRVPNPMARASSAGFPRTGAAPLPPAPPSAMRRSMVGATAPAAPMAPTPVAIAGVAGAQMGSITTDWARLTGVTYGVLVMRAPVGSLAAESGLRDADVIVRAGGRDVRTLPELRDLLAMAWSNGDRALAIDFVRERKVRSGVLRW